MTDTDHQSALDDVLRKIGRNVLYFQRMEAILKILISGSRIEGTPEELISNLEKAVDGVSRQTMGNLAKSFVSSFYGSSEEKENSEMENEQIWLSFSSWIEASPDEIEETRAMLNTIVEERNVLIHQMLGQFDQTSVESCQKLGALLDAQAEKMRPAYASLRSQAKALEKAHEVAGIVWMEHIEESGK